jgi:pimeloyl-ACP methyl ester carboxylesterase
VVPLLRRAGHEVFTPTLTGLGERAHLAGAHVDLTTHALDVANLIRYEELRDVVLVGHSYGGAVITAAAELIAEGIGQLIYLDALVPRDGMTLEELQSPARRAARAEQVRTTGDGWRLHPSSLEDLGVHDPADAAWVRPRLVDHPYGTYRETVRLGNPAAGQLPRTYVYCTVGAYAERFAPFAAAARVAGWRYHELATGHDAMVSAPNDVAELLLTLT